QSARHGGSKRARLLAGGAVGHPAIDHDANRPARHDKENDDHGPGDPAHLLPQAKRVRRHAAALLAKPGGCDVSVTEDSWYYFGCQHELLSLLGALVLPLRCFDALSCRGY